MIALDVPFPQVGSLCFEKATGRKLKILQHRADDRVFCRREDLRKPSWVRTGTASGNITLDRDQLAETEADVELESGEPFAAPESWRTIAGKPRESRKAKRPAKGRA
ncbi:hypothetical protein [Erythrobacter rubeus]|uniref:Uncharacterized protein n=1 Tax=Erythrobacter rubeus TaxID=2760803 RepID=A0ABR8KPS6_9SPHN|nr:hypothetical protein [Erythrobacter rubeus]MBD2842679.1 hypothetical protein [Erythrobacter rubeus]